MKTTFNFVNDLHLDHHVRFTTNHKKLYKHAQDFVDQLLNNTEKLDDTLIIAGDFGHVNYVSRIFLELICPHFNHVFATFGNHDFYLISKSDQKKFNRNSYKRVEHLIDTTTHIENLTWLTDDTVHEVNDVKIAGHPMMACPTSREGKKFYNTYMNDASYIFFPDSLLKFHEEGIKVHESLPNDLDIFISHYPLVKTPEFRDEPSEESYYNIMDESQLKAKHYMFGHVHQRDSFKVGNHSFHTHAVGYHDESHLDISLGYIEIKK